MKIEIKRKQVPKIITIEEVIDLRNDIYGLQKQVAHLISEIHMLKGTLYHLENKL